MNCKRKLAAFLLLVLCLCFGTGTALATEPASSEAEELVAIQAAMEAEEAARAIPSIPPVAGGMGLAVLLVFGLLTSRKHQEQEEDGYDPVLEDHRISDPYSRLSRREKRRHHLL